MNGGKKVEGMEGRGGERERERERENEWIGEGRTILVRQQ